MSVTSIKNRIGRLEQGQGLRRFKPVVIWPNETEQAAFARAGIQPGDDVHVLRVRLVSPRAA